MKILALDTSTSLASIAITNESNVIAQQTFACQRSLSSRLIQEIDHLLSISGTALNTIDLFAVALGPGSFTGVRCGVAATQGLSLATGKPCIGFSTLAALAMNFSYSTMPICSLLDARKNEVYGCIYNCIAGYPTAYTPETVLPIEQFIQQFCDNTDEQLILVGEGAVRYQSIISSLFGKRTHFAIPCHNVISAASGAILAYNNYQKHGATILSSLLPHYIRPSDAEITRLEKLATITKNDAAANSISHVGSVLSNNDYSNRL